MLIDGHSVPNGLTLRADVVVIGAGPAGITVAEALAGDGRHVLLVESAGRHHGRQDDDALDGDGSGEPFPLQRSRHRGFGGSSTHWTPATGLCVRPLDAIDFAARSCRPADQWPFGHDELEPFYAQAYRSIGVEADGDPGGWLAAGSPTPLSWSGGPQLAAFQFARHDCFTQRFDEVRSHPTIDLLLRTTVCRLVPSPDDTSVDRAEMATTGGRRFSATAEVFVLACGGIDNARVLLASPGRHGCPVGNEHDNVGRYFMDHLSVDTGVIVPLDGTDAPASTFAVRRPPAGGRYQPMLWLGEDIIEREGIPNAAFWIDVIDPLYRSIGVGAARSLRAAVHARPRRALAALTMRTLAGSSDLVAYAARRRTRPDGPGQLAMRIMTEQLPNRDSRIRLSARRDATGMPRVDVDWRISGADLDVIDAHQELLGKLLSDRGVATLEGRFSRDAHPGPIMSNYHHLGTTRMHRDPRYGVVDPDGKVHSTTNVYVVGSSTFPTGGYVNPTLSILALAWRTARCIAERWTPLAVAGGA